MSIDVSTLAVEVKSSGISETASGLNKIFIEAGKAERRAQTLTSTIAKLSQMFTQGSAAAEAYQIAVANANRSVGGHDAASTALTVAMKALAGAVSTLNGNMDKLDTATRRNTKSMRDHTNGMSDAHAMARGLSGSLGALWVTYGNLAPLAAGLAIGSAFKAIVTEGAKVENTLEGIRVKGEETFESVGKMRDALLDLGKGMYGPLEVAKTFEILIMAGLRADQALTGVRDTMNLAIVGGTSIETAATTLVQVSTSLGYTAEGFGRVGDVIAKTAAVSMSSVESLSGSFRSAASVGKLYGASLVDIGTGLAALSQLGIQGTASGTSLKNFYKGLATETDKLKNVMSAMHDEAGKPMTPKDLKDANGNFLDLVTVVSKLSTGLNSLSPAQQKLAIDMMANERGMKTLVEVLDLYRKKTADGTNELVKFRDAIADSYAFTNLGAAQMALTVENQFKSVKNTLMSSFVKAFEDIQPQLLIFASQLKTIFASSEFQQGIQTMAFALAELAVSFANNIGKITLFVEGILAFKGFLFVIEVIKGLETAIAGITLALGAAKIAATAFQVSLGILGVALMAAGAAWVYYHNQKTGTDEKTQAGLTTLSEYSNSLATEADRMEKVNKLLREGKSAQEAQTTATQEQALALAEVNRQKALQPAQDKISAIQAKLDAANNSKNPNSLAVQGLTADLKAATNYLGFLHHQADTEVDRIRFNIDRVRAASKETATLQEAKIAADAAAQRKLAGNGVLPDKGALSQQKTAEAELLSIMKVTEEYKAKTAALEASLATGVKVAAGEREAAVLAEISSNKYGKLSEAMKTRLVIAARGEDAAKGQAEVTKELYTFSEKLTKKYAEESAGLAAANEGHTKLVGAYQAEAQALVKRAGIDPNGKIAQQLFEQAKATDAVTEADSRAQKLRKGAEALQTEALSLFEAGDALVQYGKRGKQTALQLAELHVKQAGLDANTNAGVIGIYMRAAALKDLGTAYKDMATLANTLKDENDKADAGQLASILTSETEKVLVKHDATLKIIQFSQAQIDAAWAVANANGQATQQQVEDHDKATAAIAAAMAQLDRSTKIGLVSARSKDLDTMIAQAQTLGSTFETAFGSAGKAIGGMVTAMAQLQQSQETYNNSIAQAAKLRAEGKDVKAIQVEQEASKKSSIAQMKSYADMAGSAKNFFKEGTTGYKALGAAEKVFRVAELAMSYSNMIQKIFFKETETAAIVTGDTEAATSAMAYAAASDAANGTVAASNAVVAVTNQGKGDPYSAFARIAAMAAIMAALGFAVGGGGGGSGPSAAEIQKTQNTGTVLGDATAHSDSIQKSLDALKTNSDITLPYTARMARSLQNIEASIAGVANIIFRTNGLASGTVPGLQTGIIAKNTGDPLVGMLGFNDSSITKSLPIIGALIGGLQGLFGKTKQDITNSGFNAKGTLGDFASGHGITQFADVTTTTSSFFGLVKKTTQKEIQGDLSPELQRQFSQLFGNLGTAIKVAGVALGADADTVMTALNTFAVDLPLSIKDLKGSELSDAINNWISTISDTAAKAILPGLEQFQQVGEGYFQTITRVASGIEQANFALSQLGITAIAYTDIVNKQGDVSAEIVRDSIMVVESATGQMTGIGKIIDTLTGSMSDILTAYKQLSDARAQFNAYGLNGNISVSTVQGAGSLDALTSGAKDFFSNFFTEVEQQSANLQGLNGEFSKLGLAMPLTKDAFRAMVKAADDGTESGDRLVGKLLTLSTAFNDASDKFAELAMKRLDTAFTALQRSVDAEKKAADDAYDLKVKAIKKQADADTEAAKKLLDPAKDALKNVQTIFDAITNALKSTVVESAALAAERRREAQSTLNDALSFSNTGGALGSLADLPAALTDIAKPSEGLFSSFEDYARDQAKTALVLEALGANSKKQVSDAQLTIDGINGTIDSIKTASDAALEALDAQHKADIARLDQIVIDAQAQIDALNGINDTLLSLADAMAQFASALAAGGAAKGGSTVHPPATPTAAPVDRPSVIRDYANSIADTPDAEVTLYNAAISHGVTAAELDSAMGWAPGSSNLWAENTGHASFAVGTNYLPHDMTANVHEGERIVPKADNIELMRRLKDPDESGAGRAELAEAIQELKSAIMCGDVANVQQTKEVVKILRKFDGDGMPPVRLLT